MDANMQACLPGEEEAIKAGPDLTPIQRYQRDQTELACRGRSPLVQRILRENPLQVYPPEFLAKMEASFKRQGKYFSPPVDPKSAPSPDRDLVAQYGGDPDLCRSYELSWNFSWNLREETTRFAAENGLSLDEAAKYELAFRLWWGIIILHSNDTAKYPPGERAYRYWASWYAWYTDTQQPYVYRVPYNNFCSNIARSQPLSLRQPDPLRFAQQTLPLLREAYGSRLPLELYE